jgi:hypothetical protein
MADFENENAYGGSEEEQRRKGHQVGCFVKVFIICHGF